MPLTHHETEQVRRFLGMSPQRNSYDVIAARVAVIEALNMATVETLRELLQQIHSLHQEIIEAAPFAGRSFQSGGNSTAQFFRGERLQHPRDVARSLVEQMSTLLDLPVVADLFGGAGNSFGSSPVHYG